MFTKATIEGRPVCACATWTRPVTKNMRAFLDGKEELEHALLCDGKGNVGDETMGLDWMLMKHKAKPGFEERYATVTRMLHQMEEQDEAESPQLQKELEEISISPYEVVGAPQVGIDDEATEWFRKNNYEPARADAEAGKGNAEFVKFWMQPFETCLEKFKGRYVMELARDKGGEASVTGMLASSVDFRGKMLRFIDGLDERLVEESYEDHSAEECLDYAKRLEEQMSKVPDGPEGKEILQKAIAWLRFWGEKGFGYWAWY